MKLLHTADWHLGKRLDHFSRLPEQAQVLAEICDIAEREQPDAILIAGDVYDTFNPPVEAIELFYKTVHRLSAGGKRAVVVIAGNHDSPDRIEASDPLARACGILLAGLPGSELHPLHLESGLRSLRREPGFIELALPACEAPLRLILTPYANELRLRTWLGDDHPEKQLRQVLQQRWTELAERYCDTQGVNVLMAHLFFMPENGVRPEEPEDEKPILTVGGATEMYPQNLPPQLQYAALGHLHRPHTVASAPCPVVYPGSPLSYSMSEAGQQKQVVMIEANPGQTVHYQAIPLHSGRPLQRKTFHKVEDALEWLRFNPMSLVELTMVSNTYLKAEERKQLFDAHSGIITLIPRLENPDGQAESPGQSIDLSKHIEELFADYFQHKNQQAPDPHLLNLFREVLAEENEHP
jgi:DNA repair protein SbcD/Mre11